jgi:hypothetical protein
LIDVMSQSFAAPRIRPLVCSLALLLLACDRADPAPKADPAPEAEPTPAPKAESNPAPVADPGPVLAPAPAPAPAPISDVEQDLVANTSTTTCVAMTDTRLDFEVDTYSGDINSIEAKAMIGGSERGTEVTLLVVPQTSSSATLPIAVRVLGTGSAKLIDGAGQSQTIVASSTGGAVNFEVNLPPDTSFSITSTTAMATNQPNKQGEAGPNPTPPSNKKAIIKPVAGCPR